MTIILGQLNSKIEAAAIKLQFERLYAENETLNQKVAALQTQNEILETQKEDERKKVQALERTLKQSTDDLSLCLSNMQT